ncbi:MAG TPA: hypothetical protein VJ440_03125 [Candidatus Brocadiaceae bacterium]|nr:hypothetical protein [Candidatus Brocadiaceae bacterium]
MAAVTLCSNIQRLTPAFRLGFVMTTEMGFSPDDNGKKAWHSLKL